MFKIDMRDLLLKSVLAGEILHEFIQFTIGKERYKVFYDLNGTNLFVNHVDRNLKMRKVEKRQRKRRELLSRSHRMVRFNARNIAADQNDGISGCRFLKKGNDVSVNQKRNSSSQTEFETIEISTSTYDLVRQISQSQQTNEMILRCQCTQTLPPEAHSVGNQAVDETVTASTQTDNFIHYFGTRPPGDLIDYTDYMLKFAKCQETHSEILHNINKMIESLGTLIEYTCEENLSDVRNEMCDIKYTLLESFGDLEINLARRDKKYFRIFSRKCAAAAENRLIITEINHQDTQTAFEQYSQSTQTKSKKRKLKSCLYDISRTCFNVCDLSSKRVRAFTKIQ